jgi:hypothetical protein
MKNLLFLAVCFVAFPLGYLCADAGTKATSTQERVITLPQDGGQWYLTVFGDATDPQYQKLQSWLQTHDGLSTLRSQTHYNEYVPTDTRYQRYATSLPGPVCIRLQNSKGIVTSEFWSDNIPLTAEALFNGIKGDLKDKTSWGCLNRRRCPAPAPAPVPAPAPAPAPVDTPPVLEDEEPAVEPDPEPSFPWILAALAIAIGAGIGVGQGFKEEHIDSKRKSTKM